MYRFDSIDDYIREFQVAYADGVLKDVLSEYDSLALVLMYDRVKEEIGFVKAGLQASPEIEARILTINSIVEVSTKRLEELGLLPRTKQPPE